MAERGPKGQAVICANSSWYLYNFRRETIAALLAEGWQVTAVAPENEFAAQLAAIGADFRRVRLSRRSISPLSNLLTFASFLRLYRSLRPDLVHHLTIKPVIFGGIAARLLGVRGIVQAVTGLGHAFTGSRLLRYPALLGYRMALGGRALTIFQNEEDRDVLVGNGAVKPEQAILIRGSGVDLQHFDAPTRATGEIVTFVMACRMLWSKGVREFIAASDMVSAQHPSCRFILIGKADDDSREGVPAAWLNECTAVRAHLTWLGFMPDIAPVLKKADVMVLPSYYGEGVPKSLLEGAAARLALISTNMPGCREVVLHGRTGLQVPPRDPKSLAQAMLRLAVFPALRTTYGQAARQLVEDEFAVQSVVARTLASYRRLLQDP